MSLKTHIAAIVANLPGQPTFLYGSDFDVNIKIDNTTHEPVIIMIDKQKTTGKRQMSGVLLDTDILMFFVRRCEFQDDPELAAEIQAEMLGLAANFFNSIGTYRDSNHNKVFNTNIEDEFLCENIVDSFDANVAGQSLETKLTPMYPDSFCD